MKRKYEFNDLVLVPVKSRMAFRGDLSAQAILHLKVSAEPYITSFILSESKTSLWANTTAN